jgi:hypothetical protein
VETLPTLTATEQATLADYESRIEGTLTHAWISVAGWLKAIHDGRLYRDKGTWADYCRDRWGKTGRWGELLLQAGAVMENTKTFRIDEALPTRQQQALELSALPATEQAEVWQEAVDRYKGKPTAAQVKAIVDERLHIVDETEDEPEEFVPLPSTIQLDYESKVLHLLNDFCTHVEALNEETPILCEDDPSRQVEAVEQAVTDIIHEVGKLRDAHRQLIDQSRFIRRVK